MSSSHTGRSSIPFACIRGLKMNIGICCLPQPISTSFPTQLLMFPLCMNYLACEQFPLLLQRTPGWGVGEECRWLRMRLWSLFREGNKTSDAPQLTNNYLCCRALQHTGSTNLPPPKLRCESTAQHVENRVYNMYRLEAVRARRSFFCHSLG